MKARCRQNPETGLWYCTRMGCTGEGATIEEAYKDMWQLYRDAVKINYKLKPWSVRA